MEIRYQRADVAGGVGPVGFSILLLTVLDVFLYPDGEFLVIAFVDGVYLAAGRCFDVGVREAEFAERRVEREAVHTAADRVDEHCGAVDDVSRSDHLGAFLQEVVQHGGLADGRFAPVDGEYRPDRDIHVDVGRTVQRVHADDVFGIAAKPLMKGRHILVLFRSDAAALAACLKLLHEGFVGIDIEFLLLFALYVFAARTAEDIHQARLVHFPIHLFGRDAYMVQQTGEIARRFGKLGLLVYDEFIECD